jgi:hypothetical protein
LNALITLALLAQYPATPGNDLAFEVAQERFVRSVGDVHDLERVLPKGHARLVRVLGSLEYDARDLVLSLLDRLEPNDRRRALVWGTFMRDRHIALFCESRLKAKFCGACEGSGLCRNRRGTKVDPGNRSRCTVGWAFTKDFKTAKFCMCRPCDGIGVGDDEDERGVDDDGHE